MLNISKENFIKDFLKFPKKNILIILLLFGFGEWFISDVINFSGGSIGFILLFVVGYFYLNNDEPKFNEPKDLNGWIKLCTEDLKFFDNIEEKNNLKNKNCFRKTKFDLILQEKTNQSITIVNREINIEYIPFLNKYLKKDKYDLNVIQELPSYSTRAKLPEELIKSEAIFYHLALPLKAKDLLWLQKIPNNMPIWVSILSSESQIELNELNSQIPQRYISRIITIDDKKKKFINIPLSFRKFSFNPKINIENTKKRLLKNLHSDWQAEIEVVRRRKLKEIQNKNQIIVAASVFASPIPSIDVLSMTVLNSLMINELKSIWGCNWSPEMIEKVSKQIIKTALAQGVVEWSSQTLMNLSKLHGPNWIIAGSFQALSAAYLTRVV